MVPRSVAAEPRKRGAHCPDPCGVRDPSCLGDFGLFEACLGRKAQEPLRRDGGYRVARGDSGCLVLVPPAGCRLGAWLCRVRRWSPPRWGHSGIRKGLRWACRSCAGRERVSPCSCLLTLAAFRGPDVSAETSCPSADGPSPQTTITQQGWYYVRALCSLF